MRPVEVKNLKLLPPAPGVCPTCAVDHLADEAHDATSLYYQVQFQGRYGRAATWAEAVAHLPPDLRAAWEDALRQMGSWTEPPPGEEPIDQPCVECAHPSQENPNE